MSGFLRNRLRLRYGRGGVVFASLSPEQGELSISLKLTVNLEGFSKKYKGKQIPIKLAAFLKKVLMLKNVVVRNL